MGVDPNLGMGARCFEVVFMILLAVECSTKVLSLALFENKVLLEEKIVLPSTITLAEKILPEISQILSRNNLTLGSLTHVALSTGPGSFTSLRIGLATIMGLSAGASFTVFGLSSLESMVHGLREKGGILAPTLLAGRGQLYAAFYNATQEGVNLLEGPFVLSAEKFSEKINYYRIVSAFGPGLELMAGAKTVPVGADIIPLARHLGELAFTGRFQPSVVDELKISYLLDPDLGINKN